MDDLFDGCLGGLLIYVLLLPLSLVVATPYILITAVWEKQGYIQNVKNGYLRVYRFWAESSV